MSREKKIQLILLLRDLMVDEIQKIPVNKEEVKRIRILSNNIIREIENE